MNGNKLVLGLGGGALILALIALFTGGPNRGDVERMIERQTSGAEKEVTALETRIAELEASLNAVSEQAGAAATSESVSAVQAEVATLAEASTAVAADVAALTVTTTEVETSVATLAERVSGVEEIAAAAVDAATSVATATEQPSGSNVADTTDEGVQPEATPETSTEETTSEEPMMAAAQSAADMTPGETAALAGGALRVFVSRLDAEAGTARVSIAGAMKHLSVGQQVILPVGDDYCGITLDGIAETGAALSTVCGDALPAPEGLSAGETALFAEGSLRAFVSRVTDDTARLTVNGDHATLALGASVPAMAGEDRCRVTVDGIDRGHVMVSAACGDELGLSEAVGAGSTVVMGDGAARVFVGSVTDAGTVRFAINGQSLVSGVSGDSVDTGEGCSVTVEDVTDSKASFSYTCEG